MAVAHEQQDQSDWLWAVFQNLSKLIIPVWMPLGTARSAGGGNHFLELVHDETGRVWVMLHSGSRNIGNITAQLYDGKAAQELEQQGITVPGGLNYLEIDSTDGRAYLGDMDWCQVTKGPFLSAPALLAAC